MPETFKSLFESGIYYKSNLNTVQLKVKTTG